MPALGAPELIIILIIIILIFGVGKLPEVGSALGKSIREFRKTADDADAEAGSEATATNDASAAPATTQPAAAVEAPRAQPAAIEAPRAPVAAADLYTVQSGDTLDSIAQRHAVSIEELMQANGYSQRDRVLYAGDRIQLPRRPSSAA